MKTEGEQERRRLEVEKIPKATCNLIKSDAWGRKNLETGAKHKSSSREQFIMP